MEGVEEKQLFVGSLNSSSGNRQQTGQVALLAREPYGCSRNDPWGKPLPMEHGSTWATIEHRSKHSVLETKNKFWIIAMMKNRTKKGKAEPQAGAQ